MHTLTVNMFAETNEDLSIVSGMARTEVVEPAFITIDQRLAQYMSMTRGQLLEVAHNYPTYGEWFQAEAPHMTFHDIATTLLSVEYGREPTRQAMRKYFKLS